MLEPRQTVFDRQIEQLAKQLTAAHRPTFLTGAGISVPSHIPDMESAVNQFGLFSQTWLEDDPAAFYQRFHREMLDPIHKYGPTKAHQIIAQLEEQHLIDGIVTTNVDHLHQLAGNHHVIEVWGSINVNFCLQCGRSFNLQALHSDIPRCPVCHGLLSPEPAFRHLGGTLPPNLKQANAYVRQRLTDGAWRVPLNDQLADELLSQSDLTIVTGSNGYYRHCSPQHVIEINPHATWFTQFADFRISSTADAAFAALAMKLQLNLN